MYSHGVLGHASPALAEGETCRALWPVVETKVVAIATTGMIGIKRRNIENQRRNDEEESF